MMSNESGEAPTGVSTGLALYYTTAFIFDTIRNSQLMQTTKNLSIKSHSDDVFYPMMYVIVLIFKKLNESHQNGILILNIL